MQKENYGSKVARQKLERGQVGIAGEYAVLTELITNGFAAARTDGNSKDVDILCSHIETGQMANVQVKTLNPNTDYSKKDKVCFKFRIANRKSNDDMLEEKIKTIEEKQIYYIFCALKNPDIPSRKKDRFFIATPKQVIDQIKERVKKKTSIIDFQLFEKPEDTKIPEGGFGLIEDYEDRWMSLGNSNLNSSEIEAKIKANMNNDKPIKDWHDAITSLSDEAWKIYKEDKETWEHLFYEYYPEVDVAASIEFIAKTGKNPDGSPYKPNNCKR